MLRWKLRLLMADKKISNKELSERSGLSTRTISRLKLLDEIEQISGRVLNDLCEGLCSAYEARGEQKIITPGDLFEFVRDQKSDPPAASLQIPQTRRAISLKNPSDRLKSSSDSKIIQFAARRAG
mgnify:CR=1 FL=1